jgi:hypothetical protein
MYISNICDNVYIHHSTGKDLKLMTEICMPLSCEQSNLTATRTHTYIIPIHNLTIHTVIGKTCNGRQVFHSYNLWSRIFSS